MKGKLLIVFFLISIMATAMDGDTCKCKICTGTFSNFGKAQIYGAAKQISNNGLKIKSGLVSPGDTCKYKICPGGTMNNDDYNIYLALKQISDAGVTINNLPSGWLLGGNTLTANQKLGTKNGWDMIFTSLNFERGRLKANGHWLFNTNMYDSGNNLFLDFSNHSIFYNDTIKMIDGNSFLLLDIQYPQKTSIDFGSHYLYSRAGDLQVNFSNNFTQIQGTAGGGIGDLFGFNNNDLRIGGDPNGTIGKGIYLKAYDVGGGNWRTGIKYLNQAVSYPDLILQPDGGDVYTNRYIKNISVATNIIDFGYNGGVAISSNTEANIVSTTKVGALTASDHSIIGLNSGRLWTIKGDNLNFYQSANGIGTVFNITHSSGDAYNDVIAYFDGPRSEHIGIGTTTPDTSLHIVGSVKIVDGNQGAGKVLTSDANGLGSWQPIAATSAGTYTPTVTGANNISGVTAYQCQYMRVGNVVTVSGKFDADPTLAATNTQVNITLPIASNFALAEECGGTASASGVAGQSAGIFADNINDKALVQWLSTDITNQAMYFQFTYVIN